MTKRFCDNCKEEDKNQEFRCEIIVQEIKRALIQQATMDVRPQLSEKHLHLCRECFFKLITFYVE